MHETDPASRLAQLRFLERVQVRDLERTRQWIAVEELRLAEQQRRTETLERVTPDWILQSLINSGSQMVHVGDCWATGKKRTEGISREDAVEALSRGAEACSVCRPDTALGLLE